MYEDIDMTGLLQRAISQIEKLPADVQDAIAARLLADIADEEAWAAVLRRPQTRSGIG